MSTVLGLDTSNYTTSCAIYDSECREYVNSRRILEVEKGSIGLRQSEVLFRHTKALPEIVAAAVNGKKISAVGVSDRPRPLKDSYMPCFLAGVSAASAVSSVLGVPLYKFSHQAGHIAAALFSADKLELIGKPFISFHVSGGTTEAVLTEYDKEHFFKSRIVSESLDLKMGQAVDRIGCMLGLKFPSGKELDALSLSGSLPVKPRPTFKGNNCSISGIENKAQDLLRKGTPPEDIAYFTFAYLSAVIDGMIERIKKEYGDLPIVLAGGVMSNSFIRRSITEKYGAYFASTELSSDNAVGIAVMTAFTESYGRNL